MKAELRDSLGHEQLEATRFLVGQMASQAYEGVSTYNQLGGLVRTWSSGDEEITDPGWKAELEHQFVFQHGSVLLRSKELPKDAVGYTVDFPTRFGEKSENCAISALDIQRFSTEVEQAIGSEKLLTALLHRAVRDTAILQALRTGDRGYAADVQKRLNDDLLRIQAIEASPFSPGMIIDDFDKHGKKKISTKVPLSLAVTTAFSLLSGGCAGPAPEGVCSEATINARMCQGYKATQSAERPLIAPINPNQEQNGVFVPAPEVSPPQQEVSPNNSTDEILVGPDGIFYLNPAFMQFVPTEGGPVAVPWSREMYMLFTQGNHMGYYFDISAGKAPIFSPIDGTLHYIYDNNGNSQVLIYDDAVGPNGGLRFELWHAVLDRTQPGQRVKAGQLIAIMSNIGYSTENGQLCTLEIRQVKPDCGIHGHLGLFYKGMAVDFLSMMQPYFGPSPQTGFTP